MRVVLGFVFAISALGADIPPAFRLPAQARPSGYELELTIVPRRSEFRGVARIAIEVTERTRTLWLNAKGLNVLRASLDAGSGRETVNTTAFDEFLKLDFAQEIGPGAARLEIEYTGELSDKRNNGLYRKQSGGDWYAFTTFTPIEARRAFPCFDEPAYKAPWRVVLHVEQADVAVSNGRMVNERNEPAGMKRVEFAGTKPLPSEVVAIAVGPFDVVDAGEAGVNRVPVRILAPRGRGREAAGARSATPEILARLEQYTAIPYPWDKLDHVAVLDMPYGAVENPGLITYRDAILLSKPERDTGERQRGMRGTIAHELAHQWFGNLVTQAWWDDVWLSEGFATWLGGKVSDMELPAFERSIAAVAGRSAIMKLDSAAGTRPVRLQINSRAEMEQVYGGIVYQKGAAILNMLEQWVGPEAFQRGLRTYLTDHALATATTGDLVAALSRESRMDVGAVMRSFLDQPRFPVVHAAADCSIESEDAARWIVPVCVHGDDGSGQCTTLAPGHRRAEVSACPAWIWPNRGGAGYFRVQFEPALLEQVVNKGWGQLTAPEKLSVIDDTADAVLSHRMEPRGALELLPAMARDPLPAVSNAVYRLLLSMIANAAPQDRAACDEAIRQILAGGGRRR